MARLQFTIVIEPKEDVTGEGVQPNDPTTNEAATWMADVLSNWSKHEALIGWRVMAIITEDD